ncbi:alpha-ketoglutarate-dependent dioxygenase alkB homolog 4-like [Asterias amurensis]|uniref:alpha-ketoglutarate-dependent dioxygenase alkB homolog 4-like n=1 Tax=Asterias amurensis TaxID=7602 RepID=UPI003AB862E1
MVDWVEKCGCKGIRTCLLCENGCGVSQSTVTSKSPHEKRYIYCWMCNEAYQQTESFKEKSIVTSTCEEHSGNGLVFPGVILIPEFVSEEEEAEIVQIIDESPWKPSQSGRWKQDYGPKVNFKRRKLKTGSFTGLPPFIQPFVNRINSHPGLGDFVPVELCNLDYRPDRGSSIDPHRDDSWLWGERLITINLLSGTFLDMTPVTTSDLTPVTTSDTTSAEHDPQTALTVRIPLPARSLIVVSGAARHDWNHGICRGAIIARRLAITLRELTETFLDGGSEETVGREVLSIAGTYTGSVVS